MLLFIHLEKEVPSCLGHKGYRTWEKSLVSNSLELTSAQEWQEQEAPWAYRLFSFFLFLIPLYSIIFLQTMFLFMLANLPLDQLACRPTCLLKKYKLLIDQQPRHSFRSQKMSLVLIVDCTFSWISFEGHLMESIEGEGIEPISCVF